jgi:tRNA modification GTPase
MNNASELIFALATPNLRSAIHLHRISGNGVFSLLLPYCYSPLSSKNSTLRNLEQTLNLGSIFSEQKLPITRYVILKNTYNETIDDVIMTFYPNPKSFTGEDVIEISTHGNPLITNQLHSFLRKIGLRDAKAGEFTQRAMLNGKLDLVQAEGINQLIHAESFGAIELARNNVEGILSKETLEIRDNTIELLAYLEAHIDFAPDEVGDYNPSQLLPKVTQIQNRLEILFSSYENGLKIKEGLKIILCGKPNAGKSSLYNGLLKQEKAIVTNIPGTTRDILEEKLLIDNKEFILLDTAGIRNTSDEVEKIGVAKTLANIKNADIICYLISCEERLHKNHNEFIISISNEVNEFKKEVQINKNQNLVIIINKKDILNKEMLTEFQNNSPYILISKDNFVNLKQHLLVLHSEIMCKTDTKKSPMLISQRQKDKVTAAIDYINEAKNLIEHCDYPEKIASLIISAKSSLEEIVGEISVDNIFEKVFSTFCIGK